METRVSHDCFANRTAGSPLGASAPEQLKLAPVRPRAEPGDPELAAVMELALDGRGAVVREVLREILAREYGQYVSDDRMRTAARLSKGRIIGCSGARGKRAGYMLTRQASTETVNGIIGEYLSRAKQLRLRVRDILREAYGVERRAS